MSIHVTININVHACNSHTQSHYLIYSAKPNAHIFTHTQIRAYPQTSMIFKKQKTNYQKTYKINFPKISIQSNSETKKQNKNRNNTVMFNVCRLSRDSAQIFISVAIGLLFCVIGLRHTEFKIKKEGNFKQ